MNCFLCRCARGLGRGRCGLLCLDALCCGAFLLRYGRRRGRCFLGRRYSRLRGRRLGGVGPGCWRGLGGGLLHGDWLLGRTGTRFHWCLLPWEPLRTWSAARAPRCRGHPPVGEPRGYTPESPPQTCGALLSSTPAAPLRGDLAFSTGARLYRELECAGDAFGPHGAPVASRRAGGGPAPGASWPWIPLQESRT